MSLYSNLIAQWKFNGSLLETKGNHPGSWTGGYGNETYSFGVNGDLDSSIDLIGVNDYVRIADDSRLQLSEFSISLWIHPSDLGNGDTLVYYGETTSPSQGDDGWGIYYKSGYIRLTVGDRSNYSSFPEAIVGPMAMWHHIVCTYDGAIGKVYVDSNKGEDGGLTFNGYGNSTFVIGDDGSRLYHTNSLFDNVCYFNRVLDQDEINILYNSGNGIEDLTVFDDSLAIDSAINEYGDEANKGGTWYYTQNKFGSDWVNKVDNSKGWTVDFNLRVENVVDSDWIIDENNKGRGIGLYVNDGTKQETINFLMQQIVFANANHTEIYDTTQEINYRLTGQNNNLKLYARPASDATYKQISDVNFTMDATVNGNSLNPVVFEDTNSNLHVVWWDDGGNLGSIYYSKFNGTTWTNPEEIVSLDNGVQFPSIVVDGEETVYVSFESKQTEGSVIGFVYRNNLGWSEPYYTGVDIGYCKYPQMTLDSLSNPCVVWEDHRRTHQEIYLNIFLADELRWRGEEKVSTNLFGSYRPSISSYMDDLFITWSSVSQDVTSHIEIMRYNVLNSSKLSAVTISRTDSRADHSNVLCNVGGKVFVVWHDNPDGKYKIYSTILSPSLDVLTNEFAIVEGHGGAKYPTLSEQLATGYIYIAWQDYKTGDYNEFGIDLDPSDLDPYGERSVQSLEPSDSAIFVALYNGNYLSSGNGSFDVKMVFDDDRNSYAPAIPIFFNGELPILYESYLFDEYGFLNNNDLLRRVRCAFYSLDRSSAEFLADNVTISDPSSRIFNIHRDYILNENISTKEIRFGDFSDVIDSHYVFKEFKYYIDDAVEPYDIKEIDYSSIGIDSISASDAVINNYGDAWIVGICGAYFYYNHQSRSLEIGRDLPGIEDDIDNEDIASWSNMKAISFDVYNNLFIGGYGSDDKGLIRYSFNHVDGFKDLSITDLPSDVVITSMIFDKDNRLYVGTSSLVDGVSSGLYGFDLSYTEIVTDGIADITINATGFRNSGGEVSLTSIFSEFPNVLTDTISSLKVDDNNNIWICTNSGLYRLYKNKALCFTTSNGLPSNKINDIAVRNTAIRYIATANGIAKMVGFNFDNFITSEDETIWNNNVKSIMWKNPNVLLAGTMSRLNQIIINDVDETYSTAIYEPASSINVSPDDLQTYYLDNPTIAEDDIVEVYINGNKIHYGYVVSIDKKTIRFGMSLNNDDIVEVVARSDLEVVSDFSQTIAERTDIGSTLLKIKDIAVRDNQDGTGDVFVISEGSENEVKINDADSVLPFDRVHLDTHAPIFLNSGEGIKIGEQIDRSVVRINIGGATDDVFETEGDSTTSLVSAGSGIDSMIISNNEEFLDNDGITPLVAIPFSNSATHDLGLSLENIVKNLTLTSGEGSVISYISDENELYVGVSKPAIVYKYNWDTEVWDELYTYDTDQYVDFIEKYNNNLMISIGHDTDPAIIYTYTYNSGTLQANSVLPLFESRAYSSHILDGKFYIGTGIGSGDEYTSGSGSSGAIYLFDDGTTQAIDPSLSKVVDDLDENVYGLTSALGSSNLLASTGPSAYIYEVDIENQASFIIYNSTEAIVSLNHQGDIGETFAGSETSGVIRRSITSNNTYDISFRTTPGKVSVLKIFPVITGIEGATSYSSTFAAVGNVIYYLSDAGTWVWKYTHNEIINDMTFDNRSISNVLYVISDTGVTKINPLVSEKVVYLKLIDRAGNASVLDVSLESDGSVDVDSSKFVDGVAIASLVDFVSENMIFELDELGNNLYTLTGDSRFYSAGKIEEEKGEYVSEIFDGTNDLVKWETLSWQVTELFDTQVLIYVRTSTSSNDILTAAWQGPYSSLQSAGVALSHLLGQFIQFKAVLISNAKGMSPTFHRATIRAITSESVHFFTTNFAMPTKLNKGIITSKKVVPVAADVVFGLNTTNSIDWTEYQEVDENRIFNINQTGHNLRVGIKFISPNRSTIDTTDFGEYGPYDSNLYVNTIDFDVLNDTGVVQNYHFKVTLFSDVYLRDEVFSASSSDSPDGFSVNGVAVPEGGVSLLHGETAEVLFAVSGAANIDCETYYFVRVEYIYNSTSYTLSEDRSFVASCTSSFIDTIDFNFTNNDTVLNNYHFRIKFYQDLERTNEYATVFSGNDRTGWMVDDVLIPEDGATVASGQTVGVVYRPDADDFSSGSIYYITIEAHDGDDYVFSDSSYSFQVRDVQSAEVCGEYADVPIVENFGLMFELDNNEFITLNI
jgi:hypothetical protein